MTLVTTKQGYLYLQVSGPGIQLASEVQNLVVVPAEERSDRDLNRWGVSEIADCRSASEWSQGMPRQAEAVDKGEEGMHDVKDYWGTKRGIFWGKLTNCRALSPGERLQDAMRNEDGSLVVLQIKYFAKSLHSSQVNNSSTQTWAQVCSRYAMTAFVSQDKAQICMITLMSTGR